MDGKEDFQLEKENLRCSTKMTASSNPASISEIFWCFSSVDHKDINQFWDHKIYFQINIWTKNPTQMYHSKISIEFFFFLIDFKISIENIEAYQMNNCNWPNI